MFIAGEGLLTNLDWTRGSLVPRLRPNVIPLRAYLQMVVLFFLMSTINNKATGFQISVPLHMVFRSGSLLSSMLLGVLVLGKSYSMRETLSVVVVTLGIFIVTYAASLDKPPPASSGAVDELNLGVWLVGVLMLLAAVMLSSLLGVVQELARDRYGKNTSRESMFYTHLLSLPFFLVTWSDMARHVAVFSASPPVDLGFLGTWPVPELWAALALNVVLQYICIRGVYLTSASTSALTTTLLMTIRKFVSLVISIVLFKNSFSLIHWIGTALLFGGSLVYSISWDSLAGAIKKGQ